MSKKNKIIGIGRVVIRNKIIRKIGLDTDICFNWINEDYSEHQPNIVNKQNRLFINYKVFGELIGNQIGDDDVDEEGVNEIRNQIFKFMRENRINLLKKSELNQNEINKMFLDLKKQNFRGNPENSDLRIISIYKIAGMDGVFSNNAKHFEAPCNHLNLHFEKPFMIKVGSLQDVKKMLRELYHNKKFKKKRKH